MEQIKQETQKQNQIRPLSNMVGRLGLSKEVFESLLRVRKRLNLKTSLPPYRRVS